MNNRAFAETFGVTGAAVSRYRSGDRNPSSAVVGRIVRAYPELLGYLMVEEAGTVASPRRG